MHDVMPSMSREVNHLKRSVLRDLLALAVDPTIISLAGGLPASEFLPLDEFRSCLETVLKRDGAEALQYSTQHAPLQEWIAGYMGRRGVRVGPEQVFITNGAQQGLAILSRLLLDPGEPAVIEQVTFPGIQQVTAGRGAQMRPIPTDLESGADLEALEAAFRQETRPRLAILVPDFHNPLGVSLSAEKRALAAGLAARYGVPLIEDDPYSELAFSGQPLPPIKAYDEAEMVFYVGSFSKILAPAVRLGWIIGPASMTPQITVIRESLDLESSTLLQRAVAEFYARDAFGRHLQPLRAANQERCETLLAALEEHFGGLARWSRPSGGLFVWARFPQEWDTFALFPRAVEHRVAYIPGAAFTLDGSQRNAMRLNFSNLRPQAIREGIQRLSEVIGEHALSGA